MTVNVGTQLIVLLTSAVLIDQYDLILFDVTVLSYL
jgi:hypothetical protein